MQPSKASNKAASGGGAAVPPLNYRSMTFLPPAAPPGAQAMMPLACKSLTNKSNDDISRTLAHALLPDLPLLMHGSGDVLPEHVNPKSVAVLAQLTERYVASLVSAAMDAHDIFTDGEVVGGGACLGIPPFPSASAAVAANESDSDDDNIIYYGKDDSEEATRKRKRSEKEKISKKFSQRKIDYWDQPLPGGDGGEEDSSNEFDSSTNDSDSSENDSDDDSSQLSSLRSGAGGERRKAGFIGSVPIDLHANQRTRDYYVSSPTAMDTRSFIFPICHDAVLFQRIKEIKAYQRAISIDLTDHALLQAVQDEGVNIERMDVSYMWNSVLISAMSGIAELDEMKGGSGSATNDADKKAKEGSVEAGLVDSNVEASWPDTKPLSRGRLW